MTVAVNYRGTLFAKRISDTACCTNCARRGRVLLGAATACGSCPLVFTFALALRPVGRCPHICGVAVAVRVILTHLNTPCTITNASSCTGVTVFAAEVRRAGLTCGTSPGVAAVAHTLLGFSRLWVRTATGGVPVPP